MRLRLQSCTAQNKNMWLPRIEIKEPLLLLILLGATTTVMEANLVTCPAGARLVRSSHIFLPLSILISLPFSIPFLIWELIPYFLFLEFTLLLSSRIYKSSLHILLPATDVHATVHRRRCKQERPNQILQKYN